MKRIEIYKKQLEQAFEIEDNQQKRLIVFQELINSLNTYSEKKEFSTHYEKLNELVLN